MIKKLLLLLLILFYASMSYGQGVTAQQLLASPVSRLNVGNPPNGSIRWVFDGIPNTTPCVAAAPGALVVGAIGFKVQGVWSCFPRTGSGLTSVNSAFGRVGDVVATTNDYTWAQINKAVSSFADITTRNASDVTQDSAHRFATDAEKTTWNAKLSPTGDGSGLTGLTKSQVGLSAVPNVDATNASNISSGTLPDARFPATLPAISGVNLTNLNASNLASGTIPDARLSATVALGSPSALRLTITPVPTFDIAGTLAVAEIVTFPAFSVAVGKEFDGIRVNGIGTPLTMSAGTAAIGISSYMESASGSDATSNVYGVVANAQNYGPGTMKALHAFAGGNGTSAGTLAAGQFQIQPVATSSVASAAIMISNTGVDDVASGISINGTGVRFKYGVGTVVAPVPIQTAFYQAWMATSSAAGARAFQVLLDGVGETAYISKGGAGVFTDSVTSNAASSATSYGSVVAISGINALDIRTYGTTGVGTLMGISSVNASYLLAVSGGGLAIGTYTPQNLTFATNNTARVTIDSAGAISFNGLTSNGFVKTSGGTGALSIDTTTYVTSITVASANGLSGSSSGGATPALTLNISGLDASKIGGGGVSTAEFDFLGTITSNVQTQLDGKQASGSYQPLDSDLTTIAGLTPTTDNFMVSVSSAWASRTPAQVKTTLSLDNVTNTSDANKPVSTAQQTALDLKQNTITFGSGVLTALGVNVGSAGAFVTFNGAGGTPSSLALASATGLPLTTGVTGVLPVANGGTNCSSATITCFNNITGFSAAGTTGTTSTNVVFSSGPTITNPVILNIAPAADFTLTQNSVVPFTSVNSGAIVNTLYLKTGFVGIGTAAPAEVLSIAGNSATVANRFMSLSQFTADTLPFGIRFQKSRNTTVGSQTIVQSGDILGQFQALGSNGTTFDQAASIQFLVDGTPGSSADMPGRIVFNTSADGSATPTERIRIYSSGGVSIGNTTDPGTGNLSITGGSQVQVTTVAGLPTCNGAAEGTRRGVSDALTPAFLVAVVGGGATHSPVYCNGTNWISF